MTMERSEKREVVRVLDGVSELTEQLIVKEVPLTIFLNGQKVVTLLTTGESTRELAVGFLLSEGLMKKSNDLLSVDVKGVAGEAHVEVSGDVERVEKLAGRRVVTSGGGKGTTFHPPLDPLEGKNLSFKVKVPPWRIYSLMEELNELSGLYRKTGGVHNSALSEGERILLFRSDIGRHNAVDKIHGAACFDGIPLEDKLLLTSGRVSSEMVEKALRMGVSLLISRSAPTTLAIDLAVRTGLTLVGFARGNSMIVYAGRERIDI